MKMFEEILCGKEFRKIDLCMRNIHKERKDPFDSTKENALIELSSIVEVYKDYSFYFKFAFIFYLLAFFY